MSGIVLMPCQMFILMQCTLHLLLLLCTIIIVSTGKRCPEGIICICMHACVACVCVYVCVFSGSVCMQVSKHVMCTHVHVCLYAVCVSTCSVCVRVCVHM